MRLPIISFAVFAVCFGLFGCTNGDEVTSMQPSLSAKQNNSTNVLLLVTQSEKIFTLQYSTKDAVNISESEYQIEGHSTLEYMLDFTCSCVDNNIYILKTNISQDLFPEKPMLEVIGSNKSNKFKMINLVKDMFNNAHSIASDYMTGKIYWIESKLGTNSIKVTDKLFEESEYIINPTTQSMMKLQVYPKRSKIIFSSLHSFWYTSNSTNSTANKLFEAGENFFIIDFTIDYITNKLCWIQYLDKKFYLKCAGIGTFDGPLKRNKIVEIQIIPNYIRNLVAFNNTFYWVADDNNYRKKFYFKNGNETAVEKDALPEEGFFSIVPSVCLYAQEESAKNNKVPHSSTEIDIPKQKQCECPDRTETPIKSENFFIVTSQKFSLMKQFTNEITISNIEIESNSQSKFKSYDSIGKITNNCAKNIIYMLKYNAAEETKKTLDVIHYDENNEFKRIYQIENMFDNAISITSDYKTGKIYWAVNDHENYSIKVTDELFSKWNYIIYPNNKMRMKKIQVYPKRSEIFFLDGNKIWYISNSPNSTSILLLTDDVIDFAIDYATDNLCWVETAPGLIEIDFYCVNIDTSSRPIVKPESKLSRMENLFGNLVAFNNTLYWNEVVEFLQILCANDGYETTVKLAKMGNDQVQSFVSLNCPSTVGAASTA